MNREIDPLANVLVTTGAYGSLFNAITAFLNPGDEIIIIEPFFDCYAPMAVSSQAKCVYVPLKPKVNVPKNTVTTTADWGLDDEDLEKAFNSKTKAILINTPNNPLGKVYTKEELEKIAQLCIKWNCICISDEVYEHIAYDRKHTRIATLPGMWERTVTIGSAGKTFSSTGAKVNFKNLIEISFIFFLKTRLVGLLDAKSYYVYVKLFIITVSIVYQHLCK